MSSMPFHDLVAHKGFADAALLKAIDQHPGASTDTSLRTLLHHMLVSNRFWILSILGEPFDGVAETRVPESFPAISAAFRTTHVREAAWLAGAGDDAFARTLESALIPGGRCLVSDAWLQVCLHSQGHRAQCARMLRALGGVPPPTDFVVWRVNRPAPSWPA
jgi:uncharacterized damage-inducible protein DinB